MSSPVSKPDKVRYVCDECQLACISEYHLNKHKSSHYDWKQCYECNLCDYSTLSLNQIKIHALKHVKLEQHSEGDTDTSAYNGTQEVGDGENSKMPTHTNASGQQMDYNNSDGHDQTVTDVGLVNHGKEGGVDLSADSNTPCLPNGALGESSSSDVEIISVQGSEADPAIPVIVLESDTDEESRAPPEQATVIEQTNGENPISDGVKSADRGDMTENDEQVPKHQEEKPAEETHDTVFSCSNCSFTTPELNHLLKHREMHLNNKCYRCDKCSFIAVQERHSTSIQRHLKIHEGSKPFKCKRCSYRAITLFQIQGHEKHHDETLPFKCRWCHYFAETQAGVGIHEQRVHEEYLQVTPKKQQPMNIPLDLSMKSPDKSMSPNSSSSSEVEELPVKTETQRMMDEVVEELGEDGKARYKCKSCSFTTAWRENYYRHCRIHTGEKPFHCKHCPYQARGNMAWYRHMKHHTANYPFKCPLCTYTSLSQAAVTSHQNKVHDCKIDNKSNRSSPKGAGSKGSGQPLKVSGRLRCPLCQFTTASETLLKLHKAKHMSSGKTYKCKDCKYTTHLLSNLQQHAAIHTSGKTYQCRFCPYVTTYKAHLDRHEGHHSKSAPSKFKCEQCTYSAGNLLGLSEHLKWHGGPQQVKNFSEHSTEDYQNNEVGDINMEQTDYHKEEEHSEILDSNKRDQDPMSRGSPVKMYECHSCDYMSKDLCALKRHLRTHTGERPFQCQHCPYSARQVTNMSRHTFQHFAKLPHKCPHCTYSVRNTSALAKHLKWHLPDTEDSLASNVRGASSVSPGSHNSPRVKIEGKPSSRKRNLNRIHRCKWCPYTSSYLHNLHRHKTHHGAGFLYKCDLCSYSARNTTGLQNHVELHQAAANSPSTSGQHFTDQSSNGGEDVPNPHGSLHAKYPNWTEGDCALAANNSEDINSNDQQHAHLECGTCGYVTTSQERLSKHMITHTSRRTQSCDLCPYRTRQSRTLWKHMKHHTVQHALKCSFCSYSSDFPRAITNHERVHMRHAAGIDNTARQPRSGEGLTCDECPFRSLTLSGLMKHKTHHTANLAFKCKSCTYTASSPRIISYHQKVHLENVEKPYECDMCPFRSAFSKCLLKHMQHHSAKLPLKCRYCTYTSSCNRAITLHEKVHEVGPDKALPSSSLGNRLCGICGYIACSRARLVKHIRKHTGEKPFTCAHCPFKTSLEDTLAKHNKHHESNGAVKCRYCSYSSDVTRVVTNHEKLHEEETDDTQQSATPPSGSKMNSSLSSSEEAMKKVKPENMFSCQMDYNCELCSYTAHCKKRMDEHMCTHTGFKPYGCDICPYRTPLKETLMRHKKHHTGNFAFKCRFCSYSAKRDFHAKEHEKVHTMKQPQYKIITTPTGSRTHVAEPGTIVKKRYECQVCDYTSEDKSRLVKHQRTHTGEKPYSCKFCPYKTALNESLWKHMKHHKIKAPMQCQKCSYSTTTMQSLLLHSKLHGDTEDFMAKEVKQAVSDDGLESNAADLQCNMCGYMTLDRSKLIKHLHSHTLEKAFSCPSCPYRSSSKENVKRHQKHHRSKFPFCCQFCSYSANNSSVVRTHEKLHQGQSYPCHKKSPSIHFQCLTCGLPHASQTDLDDHRREDHPSEKCFQCPECPFVSQWEKALKKHRYSHIANFANKCRLCSFTSPKKYVIRAHEQTHKNAPHPTLMEEQKMKKLTDRECRKIYTCSLCPFRARQQREYENHLIGHDADHPYKCPQCSFSAKENRGLSSHLRVHDRQKQRILKCSTCGFSTAIASLMKLHEVKHKIHPKDGRALNPRRTTDKQKRLHYCGHCSFSTHHHRAYKIHLMHHGAKLPFKCTHCTFACQLRRHLTRHINNQHRNSEGDLVEQQDGPKHKAADKVPMTKVDKSYQRIESSGVLFKCPSCKFSTKKKYLWLIHKGRHSEDKIFRCDECDFTTKCAGSILPHIQWKHMGQWPRYLQCKECPYETSDTRCLNNHMKHHTENYAIKCSKCSWSTDLQHLLEKHFKVHSAKHKSKVPRASQRGFTSHAESLPQSELYVEEESMDSRSTDPTTDDVAVSGRPQKIAPRQCNFCGRRFFRKVEWKRHTKRHKQAPSGPQAHVVAHGDPVTGMLVYTFVCWFCGRRFNGQEEWYRHMQHHRF
ncbi:ZNF208 [Branchiostoma lanceolatum]|uniref:ZNF208 protein n=1 Tax=Branchiostoma lanceolatum TaxID=7740 RepID=A0A8J9ZNN4_BRALA|nr:ZNF208 [Branchiostoma lanceolatum]